MKIDLTSVLIILNVEARNSRLHKAAVTLPGAM